MSEKPFVRIHDVVVDIVGGAANAAPPKAVFCQDHFWNGSCFAAGDVWLDSADEPRPLTDVLDEWLAAVDAGHYDGDIVAAAEEGRQKRDETIALNVIFTVQVRRHRYAYVRADVMLTAAEVRRLLTEHSDRNRNEGE